MIITHASYCIIVLLYYDYKGVNPKCKKSTTVATKIIMRFLCFMPDRLRTYNALLSLTDST